MEEVKTELCEKCCNDKDIILLIKDTDEKYLCNNCFNYEYLYDGWKNIDFEICVQCKQVVNCLKNNIYLLIKNEEEKIWCGDCFDELWREAYKDGWRGYDIEEEVDSHEKYF